MALKKLFSRRSTVQQTGGPHFRIHRPEREQDATGVSPLRCMVAYNRYGGYCVPESSQHRIAAQLVMAGDVYEPQTIEYMRANCGSGDIVHAGTYFGDFLPGLSSGLAAGARVWAFEPNIESYRCARVTLEINGIDNVTLTHAGLGASAGSSILVTTDDQGCSLGGASHLIASQTVQSDDAVSVRIVPVDQMVGADRQVSILQLDVEGHEQAALAGALQTIRRCRPILILEIWPDSTLLESEWFAEHILSLGYRKHSDIHDNTVYCC